MKFYICGNYVHADICTRNSIGMSVVRTRKYIFAKDAERENRTISRNTNIEENLLRAVHTAYCFNESDKSLRVKQIFHGIKGTTTIIRCPICRNHAAAFSCGKINSP